MVVTINADTVNIGAFIETTGNANNFQINVPQKPSAGPNLPGDIVECACFNDAPLDLLSVNFTGREREIALIIEFLEKVYGDVPTRCAIHGMHGVGKSQISNALAKELYNNGRYRILDASHHNRKAPSRLREAAQARVPSSMLFHRRRDETHGSTALVGGLQFRTMAPRDR